MIQDIQALLDRYWTWLRDRTSLREINDWIEITTPYLDRHNDCLQIYAKRTNGGFVLTDDGYVLDDLEQSGCKIDGPKRQALFKTTLKRLRCAVRREGARNPGIGGQFRAAETQPCSGDARRQRSLLPSVAHYRQLVL